MTYDGGKTRQKILADRRLRRKQKNAMRREAQRLREATEKESGRRRAWAQSVEKAEHSLEKVVGRKVSGGVAALVALRYLTSGAFQDPDGSLGGPFQCPVFAYPGAPILGVLNHIYASRDIRRAIFHVPNETIGGYAAVGFAKSTGRVGFGIYTSGPGINSDVNPCADAWADSSPLLIVSGNVATGKAGSRAFQEENVSRRFGGISKRVYYVTNAADIPSILFEACNLARSGRPGPVIVDLPEDVLMQEATFGIDSGLESKLSAASFNPELVVGLRQRIAAAQRPLIYVGGGARNEKAKEEVRRLAGSTGILVVHSLMGKGVIDGKSPLSIGMAGMYGAVCANLAIEYADLVIAIGARFSDRTATAPGKFAPHAYIVDVNVDPEGIGPEKRQPGMTIAGDAGLILAALNSLAPQAQEIGDWCARINSWKERFPFSYAQAPDRIKPQYVITTLDEALSDLQRETVVATGVGDHQMWTAQYLTSIREPRQWVTSGGFGAMGTDLSYAAGAALGNPEKTVVVVVGEASYEQLPQAVKLYGQQNGLDVKVVCLDNYDPELDVPGAMIGARLTTSGIRWRRGGGIGGVPVVELAAAYGIPGKYVLDVNDVPEAIRDALSREGPFVTCFKVDTKEKQVYPVMKPGSTVLDTILSPNRILRNEPAS